MSFFDDLIGGVGKVLGVADGVNSLFGGGGDRGGYDGSDYADQLIKQRNDAKLRARNLPLHQVRGLEKAGINPLVAFGGGVNVGAGAGYVPSIGDSHSTSGGLFAQTLQMNHEKQLQETALAQENEKLREEIDNLSKPRQPGYMEQYGGILPLPSEGGSNAVGRQNPQVVSADGRGSGVPAGPAIGDTRHVAPGREFEAAPYASGSGLTEISNKYTDMVGGPVVVPGSDGEPWGIDEVATAVVAGGPQVAWRYYRDYVGQPFANWMTSIGDSHGISEDRDYGDRWRGTRPRSIAPTQSEIDKHTYRRNAFGG